jgi:hypothetical protein
MWIMFNLFSKIRRWNCWNNHFPLKSVDDRVDATFAHPISASYKASGDSLWSPKLALVGLHGCSYRLLLVSDETLVVFTRYDMYQSIIVMIWCKVFERSSIISQLQCGFGFLAFWRTWTNDPSLSNGNVSDCNQTIEHVPLLCCIC